MRNGVLCCNRVVCQHRAAAQETPTPPTLTPEAAAQLVCRAMAARTDDSGAVLVNMVGSALPPGMPGAPVGGHGPFVAMRDVAYYAAYGKVRPAND